MRMLRFLFLPLMGALSLVAAPALALEKPNPLPSIGTSVRVMAPALGSGWHYGEFNQLRVVPPCYRVIIFSAGSLRRIEHILSVNEFTRIQVTDERRDGRTNASAAVTEKNDDGNWREFPLEPLHAAEQSCRVRENR